MAAFSLALQFGALPLDSQLLYAVPQGSERHTQYLGDSCLIVPCFMKRFDDGLPMLLHMQRQIGDDHRADVGAKQQFQRHGQFCRSGARDRNLLSVYR
jgi:hypothetical protein